MANETILPPTEFDGKPQFLPGLKWEEENIWPWMLDVTQKYERPLYTLEYHGSQFAPLGGIHALTGQSGHGKTFSFTMLITALLGGDAHGQGLKCCLPDDVVRRVLYIDTEMELGNTQLVNARIYSMMGWQWGVPHDEFRVMCLREQTDATERWKLTLKAIDELRPTVVFIDGLLDVISDFNDNSECQKTIYQCMAAASHYGISIWCLVHENPGSTKMVGHLGSMLSRKVTDVFKTKKNKNVGGVSFTIQQEKARGRDVDEITFIIEDGPARLGEPRIVESASKVVSTPAPASEDDSTDWRAFVKMTISSQGGISTRDLYDAIKRKVGCSTAKAVDIVDKLVSEDIISRDERKRYHISHGAVQTEFIQDGEDDCPF